jgi:hypothetical protein
MENLNQIKEKYKSFKNILTIIESGDIHDKRYKLIIASLTVEQLEGMQRFVYECENYGIQYLREWN